MFYSVTQNDITTMLSYTTGLIGDFMPVILVVIGVSIAMYVFRKITK